jgi:hypothetical protein
MFSNVSVPTAKDICQSALTAALALIVSLLAAFLGSPAGEVSPLLPDIPEGKTHIIHISMTLNRQYC